MVGITCRRHRPSSPGGGCATRGLEDRVDPVQDYRELGAESGSTPSSASGCGARRRGAGIEAAREIARVLEPHGAVLNHGIVRVAAQEGGAYLGGEFSNRYVFPDGELLNLSRAGRVRARRAGDAAHRGPAHRLRRRDAAPLDHPARPQPRRGRAARRRRAAAGCGACTCAPRATASAPATTPSTSCCARGRSPRRRRAHRPGRAASRPGAGCRPLAA